MLKFITAAVLYLFVAVLGAQTVTDNFDSYTAGSYLAASSGGKWKTWSGNNGGTDDVAVSNAKANSGSNSIYFSSNAATGGPADIVFPFSSTLDIGKQVVEFYLFVESGKLAYLNFQAKSPVGTQWACDWNFNASGQLIITDQSSGELLKTSYTQNAWIKLTIDIDLSTKKWIVKIDDVTKGNFSPATSSIYAIDIYPTNNSSFYIDDFSSTYTASNLSNVNAAATGIQGVAGFLATQAVKPTIEIRNLGTSAITSIKMDLTYGANTTSQTFSSINIASKSFATLTWPTPIILNAGAASITATITQVNGAADNVVADDVFSIQINPLVPAAKKVVIAEEGTGTWCGWCPRGAVMLKNMHAKFDGLFQGIAVHNGDVMTNDFYDRSMASLVSGYPSALVDRGAVIDPSGIETDFLKQITQAPNAYFKGGAKYNTSTKILDISLKTIAITGFTGNYRLACVIVEDDVKGTTTAFNQSNYYAGGSRGVMGGFETLPNPVPASSMVYDHVARGISPGFGGVANAYGTSVNANQTFVHNFSFSIQSDWNTANMHIVGMFIDPSGKINNGFTMKLKDAIDSGFVSGTQVLGSKTLEGPDTKLQVFPNPAKEKFTILCTETGIKNIEILSADGKIVFSQIGLNNTIEIDSKQFSAGIYTVVVKTNSGSDTRKLIIE